MRDITNVLQASTPSFQVVPCAAGQSQEPSLNTTAWLLFLGEKVKCTCYTAKAIFALTKQDTSRSALGLC